MKIMMIRVGKNELASVPECHKCKQAITDFTKANLCAIKSGWEFPIEMAAFHWECDPHTYPWQGLSTFMKSDQRLRTKKGELVGI